MVRQQLGAEFQRLLGSTCDDDLINIDWHAAENPQIVRNSAAQGRMATCIAVIQHFGIGHAPVLVLKALP